MLQRLAKVKQQPENPRGWYERAENTGRPPSPRSRARRTKRHHKSLQQLEDELPPDLLFRVSRQQILDLTTIEKARAHCKGGRLPEVRGRRRADVPARQTVRFEERLSL